MKQLILLLLLPVFSYSQELNTALNFHNLVRGYYDLKPLKHNDSLDIIAQSRADNMANKNEIYFNNNSLYGESVFYTDYFSLGRDYYLEASVGWALDDVENITLKQMLCNDCKEIGFGLSVSDDKIYIVAIYDKLYN